MSLIFRCNQNHYMITIFPKLNYKWNKISSCLTLFKVKQTVLGWQGGFLWNVHQGLSVCLHWWSKAWLLTACMSISHTPAPVGIELVSLTLWGVKMLKQTIDIGNSTSEAYPVIPTLLVVHITWHKSLWAEMKTKSIEVNISIPLWRNCTGMTREWRRSSVKWTWED